MEDATVGARRKEGTRTERAQPTEVRGRCRGRGRGNGRGGGTSWEFTLHFLYEGL